jgi:hypothetical protein
MYGPSPGLPRSLLLAAWVPTPAAKFGMTAKIGSYREHSMGVSIRAAPTIDF